MATKPTARIEDKVATMTIKPVRPSPCYQSEGCFTYAASLTVMAPSVPESAKILCPRTELNRGSPVECGCKIRERTASQR